MKVSLNWLKDYVNLEGISNDEIIERLTMAGLEVEDFVDQTKIYKGLVVGYVREKQKHPDADRLSVCKVFDGKEELQVVCGARNVDAGQKVVFAPIGTIIPKENLEIKKAKIRGVESSGMICAEDELELSDDHSGIMILDNQFEPGTAITDALKLNDLVMEIGITPNRPDALSHIGVARDLAALYNRELRLPKIDIKESEKDINSFASVSIEDEVNCPRYSAVVVTGVWIKESPEWLLKKLKNIGQRPINNVVDVTNFINHEIGQPLHAFDLDQLSGNKIIVRCTDKEIKFTTLDSNERTLPTGTLMICDGKREVAIAGVMGGENSEVTYSTKNILIESAYFNPPSIRRTSRNLQLSTDSSYRFERGTDPSNTLYAAQRAAQLIVETAGGVIAKGSIDVYPKKIKTKEVKIRFARITKVLGFEIPKQEVIRILQKLGINTLKDLGEALIVVVPTYRPDIEREEDLIEEAARIFGYEKIPTVAKIGITLDKKEDESAFVDNVRECAVALGLFEMVNNPLISETDAKLTGNPIGLSNPISKDMSYLRTSLVTAALHSVAVNINKGEKDLALFEVGNVFNLKSKEIKSFDDYIEEQKLLFILTGKKRLRTWHSSEEVFDFYDLKGVVKSFLRKFSLDNLLNDSYNASEKSIYEYQFTENLKDAALGIGGKLNKAVLKNFDIGQDVYCFEFNLDKLKALGKIKKSYFEPLKYPKVLRDCAFIFDRVITYQSVKELILKQGSGILKSVELFDLFGSMELGEEKKSMAFSLEYYDHNRTLTEEEVEKDFQNIITSITKKFNATLRGS